MVLTPIPKGNGVGSVTCRILLMVSAGLVVLVGLTVLALEIAVYICAGRIETGTLTALTIISCTAVLFAILAGVVTVVLAGKGGKRNFLIGAILSAIAVIFVTTAVSLSIPFSLGQLDYPLLTGNILSDPPPPHLQSTLINPFYWRDMQPRLYAGGIALNDEFVRREERLNYDLTVVVGLRRAASVGMCLLLLPLLICAVVCALNCRRGPDYPQDEIKYHLAPRESTAYQDPRVDRMITDL